MGVFKRLKLYLLIRYLEVLKRLNISNRYPIHYIGGSEALPPPLSMDEENYLLSRLEGDDYAVKTVLIERNLRLVVYIARKFENTGVQISKIKYSIELAI